MCGIGLKTGMLIDETELINETDISPHAYGNQFLIKKQEIHTEKKNLQQVVLIELVSYI